MTLDDIENRAEEIFQEWQKDGPIDEALLNFESSTRIAALHNKYWMIYMKEKYKLGKIEEDLKTLKSELRDFYRYGHNTETKKRGWEYPPKGQPLKTEIEILVEDHKDVIGLTRLYGEQKTLVEYAKSLPGEVSKRSYLIRDIIDNKKFENGVR